jgi:hypothetical protein
VALATASMSLGEIMSKEKLPKQGIIWVEIIRFFSFEVFAKGQRENAEKGFKKDF